MQQKKKRIYYWLIAFLFMIPVVSYTQTTIPDTTISNAERIIDKYSGKIANTFTSGIEKITPVAIDGFKIAVKLQIANGIFNLLVVFSFILLLSLFFKEYNRLSKLLLSDDCPRSMNKHYGPWNDDNVTAKLCIYALFSVSLGVASPFCLYDAITHLIAPEWFAIKEIINLFN